MSLIGTLAVNVVANTGGIEVGLRKAQQSISWFTNSASAIGDRAFSWISPATFGIETLMTAFESAEASMIQGAQSADSLVEMSEKLGSSGSGLKGLEDAAAESGVSIEALHTAMARLNEQIGDVRRGNTDAIKLFQGAGIDPFRLAAMDSATAFKAIAEHAQSISNPMERASVLADLFGKSGRELGPLMSQGAAGIERLVQNAKQAGRVLDDGVYSKAAEYNDQLERSERLLEAQKIQAAAMKQELLPLYTTLPMMIGEMAMAMGRGIYKGTVGEISGMFPAAPRSGERSRTKEEELQAQVAEADRLKEMYRQAEEAAAGKKKIDDDGKAMLKEQERLLSDMTRRYEDNRRSAEQIAKSVKTPAEVFKDTTNQLEELRQQGLLTWGQISLATEEARNKMEDALEMQQRAGDQKLGSKGLGSAGAFSSIAEALNNAGGLGGSADTVDAKATAKNTGATVKVLEEVRAGIDEMKVKPVFVVKEVRL